MKTFRLALLMLTLLVLSSMVQAKEPGKTKVTYQLNDEAVNNFISGLKADNTGLRKSCIYFAGKYKIAKALFPLMEQLRKETDPEIKILLANSLYQIGDGRGLYLVKLIAERDNNPKVRKRCGSIYDEYLQVTDRIAAL